MPGNAVLENERCCCPNLAPAHSRGDGTFSSSRGPEIMPGQEPCLPWVLEPAGLETLLRNKTDAAESQFLVSKVFLSRAFLLPNLLSLPSLPFLLG